MRQFEIWAIEQLNDLVQDLSYVKLFLFKVLKEEYQNDHLGKSKVP